MKSRRKSQQVYRNFDLGSNVGDDHLVTVETSVSDENGSNLIRHSQINLLSHCIFCLRKTIDNTDFPASSSVTHENLNSSELSKNVPRAHMSNSSSASPQFLSTFNSIWGYFGRIKEAGGESNEDPLHLLEESKTVLRDGKNRTTFLDLPRMCVFCAGQLELVHGLFTQLKTQLKAIGEIVEESKHCGKYSWRGEQFERILTTSSLEQSVITATINILDELGKLVKNEPKYDEGPQEQDNIALNSKEAMVSPTSISLTKPATSDPVTQFGASSTNASSTYVEVPSADNDITDNFVDEDDDWNDSDSDYIKSEHDDDFSEGEQEEDSSDCEQPGTGSSSKKTIPHISTLRSESETATGRTIVEQAMDSASTSNYKRRTRRQRLEQNGALLVKTDPVTGEEKFICRIGDCGETYNNWVRYYRHEATKHSGEYDRDPGGIQCDECDKHFNFHQQLQRHKREAHPMKAHHATKQICDLCHKTIATKELHEHVRNHVGDEYLMPCPSHLCRHVYSSPNTLSVHLSLSRDCRDSIPNAEKILGKLKSLTSTCQVCGHKGKNRASLRGHLERMHEISTKNFSCPIDGCILQFTVRQSVVIHICQHHKIRHTFKEQKCRHCSERIAVGQMENHLKETHGVGADAVIKCNLCPFLFAAREHLVEHLFVHRYSVLTCDICTDLKFSKHGQLREHYMNVHNIGTKFQCEHCEKVYLVRGSLRSHMNTEHAMGGQNDKLISALVERKQRYKCEICDVSYSGIYHLHDHKIEFHGQEPYSCKLCSETFVTRKLYHQHQRDHVGVVARKEFKCDVEGCTKSFAKNSLLKQHMSVHAGEKPHICESCGKSFATRHGLTKHVDSVHRGLRPYCCESCGESFANTKTLKTHQLIHTGERPHACPTCGQRFRHKEVLRRHLQSHQTKGADFKPNGPMKHIRKRVERKRKTTV